MQQVNFRDLGLIDYKEAWDLQERLFKATIQRKIENRRSPDIENVPTEHHLLFCEHPHVYTLGKSGSKDHLLLNEQALEEKDAVFYKINRGGDITYHGPGQIVAYPIFDLDKFFTDIHKYLRYLEEAVIGVLKQYGIKSGRIAGLTGVWIDAEDPAKARKICAYGVRCSRWVTMHGLAFNVNSDLDYFGNIIPCGIPDKAVTSMHTELGRKLDMEVIKGQLKVELANLFDLELNEAPSGLYTD